MPSKVSKGSKVVVYEAEEGGCRAWFRLREDPKRGRLWAVWWTPKGIDEWWTTSALTWEWRRYTWTRRRRLRRRPLGLPKGNRKVLAKPKAPTKVLAKTDAEPQA